MKKNVRKSWNCLWNRHALQGQEPPVQGTLQQRTQHSQITVCMYRGSSRINEKAFRKNSADRSYCGNGTQFSKSLQSCAQVYLHASSNETTGCQRSGRHRMGKARKISSMANDQSKEQKRGHQRGIERAKKSSTFQKKTKAELYSVVTQ